MNRCFIAPFSEIVATAARTPDPGRFRRYSGSLIRAVITVLRPRPGRAPAKGSFPGRDVPYELSEKRPFKG